MPSSSTTRDKKQRVSGEKPRRSKASSKQHRDSFEIEEDVAADAMDGVEPTTTTEPMSADASAAEIFPSTEQMEAHIASSIAASSMAPNSNSNNLRLYITQDHGDVNAGGGSPPCSVVMAHDPKEAIHLLDIVLAKYGLPTYEQMPYTFSEPISFLVPGCSVLSCAATDPTLGGYGALMGSEAYQPVEMAGAGYLFVCVDHDSAFPVPPVSLVIHTDRTEAYKMLDAELIKRGCKPKDKQAYELHCYPTTDARAILLSDGSPHVRTPRE